MVRLLALVALASACIPPPPDGGAADAGAVVECSPNLPPPSDPCLADQCGNAIGVGQPCTAGGSQCSDWDLFEGEAGLCTADVDDTDLWFCTRPCDDDADCGDDAVCQGDPEEVDGPKGCVPDRCASN